MTDPQIHVEERSVSHPGQLLADNAQAGEGCYAKDGKVYALLRGLVINRNGTVSIIPVSGVYTPKVGDFVTGVISHDFGGVYLLDMKGPYVGVLREPKRDDRRGDDRRAKFPELEIGDIVNAKIVSVDETKEAQLASPWKLSDGYVIHIDPKKVPRLIGKKKSMLNMLKDKTGCNIKVGQNGLIWVKGEKSDIVEEVVNVISKEAHTSGLTDKINNLLDELVGS